jgi:CHAD domain-containing protein
MAIQSVSDLTGRTRRSVPQDVAAMAAERFGRRARQLLSTDPSRSNLHQVRLRAKRLRYSAELLRDVGGPNESRLLDALVRFQDLLGEWNDHLCAVRRVSAVARQNRRLALQGDFCGRLLAYASGMTEAAEQQRATIIEQWPGLEAVIHSALNGGADAAVPEPSAAFDAQDA